MDKKGLEGLLNLIKHLDEADFDGEPIELESLLKSKEEPIKTEVEVIKVEPKKQGLSPEDDLLEIFSNKNPTKRLEALPFKEEEDEEKKKALTSTQIMSILGDE